MYAYYTQPQVMWVEGVLEDHHAGDLVVFFWELTEWRDLTPVLIHPGKLTTPRKYTMVTKEDT